jgi:hypothetical protein
MRLVQDRAQSGQRIHRDGFGTAERAGGVGANRLIRVVEQHDQQRDDVAVSDHLGVVVEVRQGASSHVIVHVV